MTPDDLLRNTSLFPDKFRQTVSVLSEFNTFVRELKNLHFERATEHRQSKYIPSTNLITKLLITFNHLSTQGIPSKMGSHDLRDGTSVCFTPKELTNRRIASASRERYLLLSNLAKPVLV